MRQKLPSKPVSKPASNAPRNWMIIGFMGCFIVLCIVGSLGAFAWIWTDQRARNADIKEDTQIALAVTQTTQKRSSQTVEALETGEAYQQETRAAQENAGATAQAQADAGATVQANMSATVQAQATMVASNATSTAIAQYEATQLVYSGELTLAKKWSDVLLDDFDQNSFDWTTGTKSSSRAEITRTIANGVYLWEAQAKQGFVWWTSPEMDEYSDFYYAVDLTFVDGPLEAEQGLVYRRQKSGDDNAYYLYEISNNQHYSVKYQDGEGWVDLIPWTVSPLLNESGSNRLALIAQGNRMVFFINDQFVAEILDNRLSKGKQGLCVGLDEEGQKGTWEFDNFEMRVP